MKPKGLCESLSGRSISTRASGIISFDHRPLAQVKNATYVNSDFHERTVEASFELSNFFLRDFPSEFRFRFSSADRHLGEQKNKNFKPWKDV